MATLFCVNIKSQAIWASIWWWVFWIIQGIFKAPVPSWKGSVTSFKNGLGRKALSSRLNADVKLMCSLSALGHTYCHPDWLDSFHTNGLLSFLHSINGRRLPQVEIPVAPYSRLWCWYLASSFLVLGPTVKYISSRQMKSLAERWGLGVAFFMGWVYNSIHGVLTHFISRGHSLMSLHC